MAELSLGPFCNWFLPSCHDVWSGKHQLPDRDQILLAYGARSSVCLAAIAHSDCSIRIVDSIKVFDHKSQVSATKFSRNPRVPLLFVGSSCGKIAIMDCISKERVKHLELNSQISKKIWSVDWIDEVNLYYAAEEMVMHWDISKGTLEQVEIGDYSENKISALVVVCSNSGEEKLAVGYSNGDVVVVWLKNGVKHKICNHLDDICSLSFSRFNGSFSDGILVSASRDGFVKVCNVSNRNLIIDYKLEVPNKQRQKNWFSVATLPSKHSSQMIEPKIEVLVGTGSGDIVVFAVPAKSSIGKTRVYKPPLFDEVKKRHHNSIIFSFAIEPRNFLAVTTSLDQQIIVWDLKNRKAASTFYTFMHGAHDITFSHIDSSLFAVALGDGVRIIKLTEDLKINSFMSIPVHLKGKPKSSANSKPILVTCVVWHPKKENQIAFARSDGQIYVVDFNVRQPLTIKYTSKSGYDSSKVYTLKWGPSISEATDQFVLYAVHQSGKIFLHFINDNKFQDFESFTKKAVAKNRSEICWYNSTLLAVGNEDGTVDIFELINNELQHLIIIKTLTNCIFYLSWNPHESFSNCLAVGSNDKKIRIYNLENYLIDMKKESSCSRVIASADKLLEGHSDKVTSLSWNCFDAHKLISSSYDKTIKIWDITNGSIIFNYIGHCGLVYFAMSSPVDPDLIFSGGEDNIMSLWRPSKQGSLKLSYEHIENCELLNLEAFSNKIEDTSFIELTVIQVVQELIEKVVKCVEAPEFTKLKSIKCQENILDDVPKKTKISLTAAKSSKKIKDKKISLFPVSNAIDNSSSKHQKLKDIEHIRDSLDCVELPQESKERLLCYGNVKDIRNLLEKEVEHHSKHGNTFQKHIIGHFQDIEATVKQAIKDGQVTADVVSLSMSVSRSLWKEASKAYVNQLEMDGEIEMGAVYLLSMSKIKEAIELLKKHQLFKEAVIIAKLKFQSDEVIDNLMTSWAVSRQLNGDFEGAAKCFASVGKFQEAATVLGRRSDQLSLATAANLYNSNL